MPKATKYLYPNVYSARSNIGHVPTYYNFVSIVLNKILAIMVIKASLMFLFLLLL